MNTAAWEADPPKVRPRLFTTEAWEALTPHQREVIRRQRMSVVDALALDHERRYHAAEHLVALIVTLDDPTE